MTQWSLEPVFGWLAIVPLAIMMLASLWFTLTAEGVGWLGRMWLVLLRLLAIAILLLGWLRPGLITTVERDSDAAVAVLIDASQSMNLPSGYGEKNRWTAAREAWQAIDRERQQDFGKTRFIPYYFDYNLRSVAVGQNNDPSAAMEALWNAPPGGKVTDLGTALAELQRAQVDPPLRAVFMLTDGVQTVIPAPTDPTLIARQLEQLDQPLIVVGLGPRSEKSQLRDLAVDGVPEHVTAFEKNRISVPAVIHARGLQNSPIKVAMTLKSAGKPDIMLK
ncbi:MAG: VWA domain-containing protein, partial [Pirellulaceae bacterium]|nr:VWA domain-containing protein [Pirellulaceae bacterium]